MLCPIVYTGQAWGRPRCLRDASDEAPPQFRGKKLPVVMLESQFLRINPRLVSFDSLVGIRIAATFSNCRLAMFDD
jgi:hypothetical protein